MAWCSVRYVFTLSVVGFVMVCVARASPYARSKTYLEERQGEDENDARRLDDKDAYAERFMGAIGLPEKRFGDKDAYAARFMGAIGLPEKRFADKDGYAERFMGAIGLPEKRNHAENGQRWLSAIGLGRADGSPEELPMVERDVQEKNEEERDLPPHIIGGIIG